MARVADVKYRSQLRRVLPAFAWLFCFTGLLCAELKTHDLHGVSSLTIDKKWVLKPGPTPADGPRFSYPSIFVHELDPEVQSAVMYVVLDSPRDEHLTLTHEKVAKRIAGHMAGGVSKEGEKLTMGEFEMQQPEELGKICRYFEGEIIPEEGEKLIIFGAVWKTDTRWYCLLSLLPESRDRIPLMKEFLGGWKELKSLNEVHADS